ncbi:hypothetical protein F4809DRAFT_661650 [Biscogniauxia mediterranea]|nr:hypothetical protein F4809DRAFT_661650 [Biscogniauxia mediterranea]
MLVVSSHVLSFFIGMSNAHMFVHRMAFKPLLHQFLIWASISVAFSYDIQLGTDISTHIPACAWACLEDFIEDSFPSVNCGTYASLSCLCSAQSTSGFTIGEGAVQCIIGEKKVNACAGNDSSASAVSMALNMCSSQPSASPNTHGTLTASFVVPSSGGPVSLIVPTQTSMPPPTLSSSTIKSTTFMTSSSAVPVISTSRTTSRQTTTASSSLSSSSSSSSLSSLSSSSSSTSTSTSTSSSTSTTAATVATSATTTSATTLAPGQVAGIAVGISSAIGLALVAICCARRKRKQKYPELEKDFYHMDDDRSPSMPPVSRLSQIFHISPPLLRTSKYRPDIQPQTHHPAQSPTRSPVQAPQQTNQASNVDRDTIGLAISRPRSLAFRRTPTTPPETPLQRKPSRLLPAKPNLTLRIPPQSTSAGRTSTMTNMTAFADLDTEAAEGGAIWRPPPSDPQSATTLYVADKWGNWLGQVSPIEKREEKAAAQMAGAISAASAIPKRPLPNFPNQDPRDQVSRSSSSYSQTSVVRQNTRGSRSSRSNSMSKPRKGGEVQIGRSDSKASVTTINSTSTTFEDDSVFESDIARLSHLSPVMEAPSPLSGRSQVTYPKIPGRLDGATIRFVPPPKRPNFTYSPPGQPSPTLGSASAYPAPLNPRRSIVPQYPPQSSGSGFSPERGNPNYVVYPYRNIRDSDSDPERVQRPPAQSLRRSNFSPTIPNAGAILPSPSNRRPEASRARMSIPPPLRSTLSPSPPTEDSFPPGPPTPPPLSPLRRRQPPPWLDTHVQGKGQGPEPGHHHPHTHSVSPMSTATMSSATSSLLAKRVGPDRAAALAFDPQGGRNSRPGHWRRQEIGGDLLSPDDAASPRGRGTLPMTPTWKPKLTPTRRGDALFLNVQ